MQRPALLILALLGLPGCASQSRIDRIEYVVAKGTVALDRRPWQGKGNLRPWEKQEALQADGTVAMIISNSCGFVQVTYLGQSLTEYLAATTPSQREITAVDSMGEWCRLRHLIVDSDELLQLRNWHGDRFVEGSAPILMDAKKRPFVVDVTFIENAELEALSVPLEPDPKSDACIDRSDLTPELLEELRAEAEMVETPEGACFARGVYLHTLLAATS